MKVKEVFEFVRQVVPHAYSDEVLMVWLNEVEGRVQTEVLLLQDQDLTRLSWPEDAEKELFAKFPYDNLYWVYLAAMCAYASNEMDDYNNHLTTFNDRFCLYSAWYAANYRPADGGAVERGYYLTAYSIALRHGFEGTEEQWLASLKGEQGVPLRWEDLTQEQKAELKGEDGDENVFIAKYGETTYGELEAAYAAEKVMLLQAEGLQIPFFKIQGTSFLFSDNKYHTYRNYWRNKTSWGKNTVELPSNERVTALEEKVAALEENGTGGITEWEAKELVNTHAAEIDPRVEALETQTGDIEAALDAIITIQNELVGGAAE